MDILKHVSKQAVTVLCGECVNQSESDLTRFLAALC